MNRVLPFLTGGALAFLLLGDATADGPLVHPLPASNPDAACAHCHEGPHPPKADQPFDDCASCHTEVHWSPSTVTVEKHALLSFALEGRHAETACSLCHIDAKLHALPNECAGCHTDRHRGILGSTCESCHSVQAFTPVEGFEHGRTGFALVGRHDGVACASCHQGELGQRLREGRGSACSTCHSASHADFGRTCESCHGMETSFAETKGTHVFDHRTTGFPLERRHRVQACKSCHPADSRTPDTRCSSCHISPHKGQLGGQCQDCHTPDRWNLARFDHDLTGWTLRGAHQVAPCASCHTNQRWVGLTTSCWTCHAGDATRAPRSVDAHAFGRVDCQDCHNLWRWSF